MYAALAHELKGAMPSLPSADVEAAAGLRARIADAVAAAGVKSVP